MNHVCKEHSEHDPICRTCVVGEGFVMSLDGPTQQGKVILQYHKGDVLLASGARAAMEVEYDKYEASVPAYEWDSPADQSDVLRRRGEVFERIWKANQLDVIPAKGKQVKLLVDGDRWRLELEYKRPGETFLVVNIDGMQVGRVPIGNVLEPLARFDPEAAGARERLVQELRAEVSSWKSKHFDNVAENIELNQLRDIVDTARKEAATAVAELALVRDTMSTPADPTLQGKFQVLLRGARAHVQRCQRCRGKGHLAEPGAASEVTPEGGIRVVNGVDVMPCPACAMFRELLTSIERS